MEPLDRRYRLIAGTYVQDAAHTRKGYQLNEFLMTLNHADSRAAFGADERAYLDRWPLTAEQRDAVLSRNWLGLIQLGANVFFIVKLAAFDGVSIQHICGQMSGVDEDTFRDMMVAGGRSPQRATGDGSR